MRQRPLGFFEENFEAEKYAFITRLPLILDFVEVAQSNAQTSPLPNLLHLHTLPQESR